jgi:aldose 1-epimerase
LDGSLITLSHRDLRLELLPELGASIASFRQDDFAIFRETSPEAIAARDGRAFSCFPLIPYSNRIRHGAFCFAGQCYNLTRDDEDPRHALHGTARFHAWRLVEQAADRARCEFAFPGHNPEWPFPYEAWQVFTLAADRLVIEIGVRNTHSAPAPAGLGLHPYFIRHQSVLAQFNAAYVWEKDAEDIPLRSVPDTGRFDFGRGHAISQADLIDHAYGGWDQRAVIAWPRQKCRLLIQADPIFRDVILYTPVGREYFAMEPVTHRPDAINPTDDPKDAPMTVLPPGGALSGRVAFILSSLNGTP